MFGMDFKQFSFPAYLEQEMNVVQKVVPRFVHQKTLWQIYKVQVEKDFLKNEMVTCVCKQFLHFVLFFKILSRLVASWWLKVERKDSSITVCKRKSAAFEETISSYLIFLYFLVYPLFHFRTELTVPSMSMVTICKQNIKLPTKLMLFLLRYLKK